MKKSVLMMLMLLLSISFAQDYKIEDFKPDSLSTWQIYATGGLSGDTYTQEDSYDEEEYSNSDFQIDPTVRFNYKKIRKMYEMDYTVTSEFDYSREKNEDNDDDYSDEATRNYSKLSLSGNFENTRYLTEKFGLVGNINFASYYASQNVESTEEYTSDKENKESESKDFYTSILLYPGISYGRIYEGKYSAKTMEILDELRKAGHLKRELTREEYIEFSQILMQKYAAYHFDSRIKKMELLENILTYLRDKNIIAKDEIQPILIVEDICSYDYLDLLFKRNFGSKIYLTGIVGLYNRNSESNFKYKNNGEVIQDTDFEYPLTQTFAGFSAGALCSKNISWNLFYEFGVTGQYVQDEIEYESTYTTNIDDETSKTEYEYSRKRLETELYGNFYYQLNSRSMASFSSTFEYNKYIVDPEKGEDFDKNNAETYQFINELDFIYFLTPKFSVNCGVSDYYRKSWYETLYPDEIDNYKSADWYNSLGFSIDFDYYL